MNTVEAIAMRDARVSLLALGLAAIVVQIVLLREILATFAGSEITAAVAMGLWLTCTGLGCLLGARRGRRSAGPARFTTPPRARLAMIHAALALLPFLMLAAVRALPLVAGVRGASLGLPLALGGILGIFIPYGLISGGAVPALGELARGVPGGEALPRGDQSARWAYALDSAGSAGGGILLAIALAAHLHHGICLGFAATPHALLALRYGSAAGRRRWPGMGGPYTLLAALVVLAGFPIAGRWVDGRTRSWRYPGQQVLLTRDTPFGQLAVTRTGTQRNLLQDAIPLTSSGDLSAEARVHPALCQVPEGARVLLIGGSIAGSLRECLLHRPRSVDCVEIDAAVFDLGRSAADRPPAVFPEPALDAPNVHRVVGDGRAYVRRHPASFDAILLHLPGPENAQWNRYYTEEFFRAARAALVPGGILSFLLPSSPNYMGSEQVALERSITAALRPSFPEITILPGESHLYLVSDRPANLEVEPVLAARGIVTRRLLDYDWAELSDPFRRDELRTLLLSDRRAGLEAGDGGRAAAGRGSVAANRDLVPVAFRHFLDLRARIDAGGRRFVQILVAVSIAIALAACLPLPLRQPRGHGGGKRVPAGAESDVEMGAPASTASDVEMGAPASTEAAERVVAPAGAPSPIVLFAVASTGFATMALELAVLLLFQVFFGNLYLGISLLVAAFLAGAALGALISPRLPGSDRAQVRAMDGLLVLMASAIGGVALLGSGSREPVSGMGGHVLLPLLALLTAVPAGVQFAAAGRIPAVAPCADRRWSRSDTTAGLGRLYLADLAGAASGTMVAGLWVLPRGGILAVVATVVGIKLAGLVLQIPRRRA